MKDVLGLRRAGESALRLIAEAFDDATNPPLGTDTAADTTIIFADIEGFTDLVARQGDDFGAAVLDALDDAVADAIATTDTRVVKRLGDGVMLATTSPAAAVLVTSALPEVFAHRTEDLSGLQRLRAGAHRGQVRTRGDDLFGYHVNVAARVAEQADGGQALITGSLLEAATSQPSLVTQPCGLLVAKGIPEKPRLFSLRRLVENPAA